MCLFSLFSLISIQYCCNFMFENAHISFWSVVLSVILGRVERLLIVVRKNLNWRYCSSSCPLCRAVFNIVWLSMNWLLCVTNGKFMLWRQIQLFDLREPLLWSVLCLVSGFLLSPQRWVRISLGRGRRHIDGYSPYVCTVWL